MQWADKNKGKMSRRKFFCFVGKSTATLTLSSALFVSEGSTANKISPSDKIGVGFIGVNWMALGHLVWFLFQSDCDFIALCDVDDRASAEAKRMGGDRPVETYKNYRKLLKRKDVDVVVISTPDHWQSIPAIHAAQTGKDIYCKKPITHTIEDGKCKRAICWR